MSSALSALESISVDASDIEGSKAKLLSFINHLSVDVIDVDSNAITVLYSGKIKELMYAEQGCQ
jgi:hypothetical protein